eukprot:NODE_2875_length_2128_cov_4.788606.p1 GENE.NODE_2875_length_2128_cov_4.788606~~NODE_2875_length_2128_cov_4.788606.p1  ORF type:complete len:619 (+),score=205.86 NODE_2875_length_2128_cov_4.788606:88-1944(+)
MALASGVRFARVPYAAGRRLRVHGRPAAALLRRVRGLSTAATGAGELLGPTAAAHALDKALHAATDGRFGEALAGYAVVAKARSPLLRSIARNAGGLLLLRAPAGVDGCDLAALFAGGDAAPSLALCRPGDAALAPDDGGVDRAVLIRSTDEAAGECIVEPAAAGVPDVTNAVPGAAAAFQAGNVGEAAARAVRLAALTTYEQSISTIACERWPLEVRCWMAWRAQVSALEAWEMQSRFGTAQDSLVDLAGILCDLAAADIRAGLSSPGSAGLAAAAARAQLHLKRARWAVERVWRPDPRAIVTIASHRVEIARLQAGIDGGALLRDAIGLLESSAAAVAAATWRRYAPDDPPAEWQPFGGVIVPRAMHELLWAKALATQAVLAERASPAEVAARRRPGRRQPGADAPRSARLTSAEACPVASAAAARAWRALLLAAGEPLEAPGSSATEPWGTEEAARQVDALAQVVGEDDTGCRFLLEVAVLVFAMGCRLGRAAGARAVAKPLAEAAAHGLDGTASADDAPRATAHVAAVLAGAATKDVPMEIGRAELLRTNAEAASQPPPPRRRWRLIDYRPLEELWVVGHGARRLEHLPAPPPLTWCFEGLQLSEAMPDLSGRP